MLWSSASLNKEKTHGELLLDRLGEFFVKIPA
jgi:hypothetical protein